MKAPEAIDTRRLYLRRPAPRDAEAIFERYASDPEVTLYLSWPTHRSLEDTCAFSTFSAHRWRDTPAGPYLVFSREDDRLVGSTGLDFETPLRASTGYVFAKDAWGRGFAVEVTCAMRDLAAHLGIQRLHAMCHPEQRASRRVLEKCGFAYEGILRDHTEFPNLELGVAQDVACYALDRSALRGTTSA